MPRRSSSAKTASGREEPPKQRAFVAARASAKASELRQEVRLSIVDDTGVDERVAPSPKQIVRASFATQESDPANLKPSLNLSRDDSLDTCSSTDASRRSTVTLVSTPAEASNAMSRPFRSSSALPVTDDREDVRKVSTASIFKQKPESPTYGGNFEKRVREKVDIIMADPAAAILTVDSDDVRIGAKSRDRRTAQAVLPEGLETAPIGLLAKQALRFYGDDWHIVVRKHGAYARSLPAPVSSDVLATQEFEVDVEVNVLSAQATEDLTLSDEPIIWVVGAVHRGPTDRLRSQSHSDGGTRRRRGTSDGVINTSKWKRRRMQLRFQTSNGPLVIELFKDDKRDAIVTETIDLSGASAEETGGVLCITLATDETIMCHFDKDFQRETWLNAIDDNQRVLMVAREGPAAIVMPAIDDSKLDILDHHAMHEIEKNCHVSDKKSHVDNLERGSRTDIFGVYHAVDRLNRPRYLYSEEPGELCPHQAVLFSVKCHQLVMGLTTSNESGKKVNVEPFFGRMALYDLKTEQKISENFHFDINESSHSFVPDSGTDLVTCSREAIFSVDYPHPDIYLVVVFEKTLQGDIASAADAYIKGAEKDKVAIKQAETATSVLKRLRKYRMPFMWAGASIFSANGDLQTQFDFGEFFRQEPDRLRQDEMIKTISELHRSRTGGGKFRAVNIPAHFNVVVAPHTEGPATVSHDLLRIRPFADTPGPPRREVYSFPPRGVILPACNTSYVNYIYLSPLSVNFSSSKKATTNSKARNVIIRVAVLDSDSTPMPRMPEGLQLIFGQSQGSRFCTSITTAVTYHCKTPTFSEEIKIAVPMPLTPDHHVLFSFSHVTVDDNSKKAQIETPIGYAWLPLMSSGSEVDDKVYDLMVAQAGVSYEGAYETGSAILPRGYTKVQSLGLGQASGPDIKWLDSKPLFQVMVRRQSTISSRDPHLCNFYNACERIQRDQKLVASIKALHAIDTQELLRFFPILVGQLLAMLTDSTATGIDDVSVNIVRFLIHACDVVHNESRREIVPILHSYAYHVFESPPPSKTGRTVHSELVFYLKTIAMDLLNPISVDNFMRHSWFFFKLIYKSMAYSAATSIGQVDREKWFSPEYTSMLEELVISVGQVLILRSKTDLDICSSTNTNVAHFMVDCLSCMDRGYILVLIQNYLSLLTTGEESSYLVKCKLEFLRIVCDYEHFIPVNFPIPSTNLDRVVGPITIPFVKRHTLVGLLFSTVRSLLLNNDPTLRRQAVSLLRSTIAKQDLDVRYIEKKYRARIALLFFPVIHIVIENIGRIRYLHDKKEGKTASSPSNSNFDEIETRDLLICFLWTIKNVEPRLLNHLWRLSEGLDTTSKCLSILSICLSIFHYKGRAEVELQAQTSPIGSADAKRLLEQQYSGDNEARRLSSNSMATAAQGWRKRREEEPISPRTGSLVGVQQSDSTSEGQPRAASVSAPESSTPQGARCFASMASKVIQANNTVRKFRATTAYCAKNDIDIQTLAKLESNTSVEVSLTTLRIINQLLYDFSEVLTNGEGGNTNNIVTWKLVKLIIQMMQNGLPTTVIPHFFQTLLYFVRTYPGIFFSRSETFCQEVTLALLMCCKSCLRSLRNHAAMALYVMMRINLSTVRTAITVAMSKIAGEADRKTDPLLRSSLSSITLYAENDPNRPSTEFSAEVVKLTTVLKQILRDTLEMQRFRGDNEMLVDLHYRVAKSYSNTPELRLTWLELIADMHCKDEKWSEAGMCVCHCAALIAEHVKGSLDPPLDQGSSAFARISPNLLFETVSKDITSTPQSKLFSQDAIIHMLGQAVNLFKRGQRYELVARLYMLYFPILENAKQYDKLARISNDMNQCFLEILAAKNGKNRFFGYFYRVGFYGELFGDLDGTEFIYKEPDVTPLSAIAMRLQTLYGKRFGAEKVNIIKDSNPVDRTTLNQKMVYIQITFVKPFAKKGVDTDYFDANHGVGQFIYETPFTKSGQARGSVETQCKRKTILTVEGGLTFPYVKKRLLVVNTTHTEMDPLDVAIEEMQSKGEALATANKSRDKVMLQMQLQGIVSMQVNAGPMEYATVFLEKNKNTHLPAKISMLQACFARLLHLVQKGLEINEELISEDQEEYHRDMVSKYEVLLTRLKGLLGKHASSIAQESGRADRHEKLKMISAIPRRSVAPVAFLQSVSSA